MLILVKLIGIIIAGMGIVVLLSPKALHQMLSYWGQGKKLYLAGILRLLIGVILLLAAPQCRLVGVILALGILCLIKGILIFILGIEKTKAVLDWWKNRSHRVIRLIGLIVIAFGALLIYSA